MSDDTFHPATVTCPAGICKKQVPIFDHDRMFGHLLSDHHWTFETSQAWVIECMPEGEAREEERRWEERYLHAGDA